MEVGRNYEALRTVGDAKATRRSSATCSQGAAGLIRASEQSVRGASATRQSVAGALVERPIRRSG